MGHQSPLLIFFLLANGISWTLWLPLLLAGQGWIEYQPPQMLHLIGSLGPAIAALMMARLSGGQMGLRDLWQRMIGWRVSWVWQNHAISLGSARWCSI